MTDRDRAYIRGRVKEAIKAKRILLNARALKAREAAKKAHLQTHRANVKKAQNLYGPSMRHLIREVKKVWKLWSKVSKINFSPDLKLPEKWRLKIDSFTGYGVPAVVNLNQRVKGLYQLETELLDHLTLNQQLQDADSKKELARVLDLVERA